MSRFFSCSFTGPPFSNGGPVFFWPIGCAGDSHEYGLTHDPFNRQVINKLILDCLKNFARFRNETIIETWNGIYAKLTIGESELILQPEEGVTIINCVGGAGMTLSFGLCEEIIGKKVTATTPAE